MQYFPEQSDADIRAALSAAKPGDEIILPPGDMETQGHLPIGPGVHVDASKAYLVCNRPELTSGIPIWRISGPGARLTGPKGFCGPNARLTWAIPPRGEYWSGISISDAQVQGNIMEAGRRGGWSSMGLYLVRCPDIALEGTIRTEAMMGAVYLYDCIGARIEKVQTRRTKYSSLFLDGKCRSVIVGKVDAIEAGWMGVLPETRGDTVTIAGGASDIDIGQVKSRGGHCYGLLAGDWTGRSVRTRNIRCGVLDYQNADTTALYGALIDGLEVGHVIAKSNGGNWAIFDDCQRSYIGRLDADNVGAARVSNGSDVYLAEHDAFGLRHPGTGESTNMLALSDSASALNP